MIRIQYSLSLSRHDGWSKINQKRDENTTPLWVCIHRVDLYFSGKWWKWAAIHLNRTAERSIVLSTWNVTRFLRVNECKIDRDSGRGMLSWGRNHNRICKPFFFVRLLHFIVFIMLACEMCTLNGTVLHHILSIICCIRQKKWKRCWIRKKRKRRRRTDENNSPYLSHFECHWGLSTQGSKKNSFNISHFIVQLCAYDCREFIVSSWYRVYVCIVHCGCIERTGERGAVRFSSCSLHIRINVLHTCLDKVQRKVPIHFYRRITKAQIKPQFIRTPDDLLLQSKYALYIQCTTPLYPFFAVLFHTFLASLWFLIPLFAAMGDISHKCVQNNQRLK